MTEKDIDALKALLIKSEEFTQEIFDWVGPLKKQYMLNVIYDFQMAIEDKITELKKEETNDDTNA